MNDFLILLQAKLDEAKSKNNINKDIDRLQKKLNKLKFQTTLDPKAAQNLANKIGKLVNQEIVISNIGIDQSQAVQSAQQTGQQISQNIAIGINQFSGKVHSEVQKLADRINEIDRSIDNGYGSSEYQNQINRTIASLKEQTSQATQSFSQWLSVSSAVTLLISKTKSAISELKAVNTLLTEISKANDKLSKSDLAQIGDNAFDVASKYGKTATDYLSGVQEAFRAGYENAESIAELSVAAQSAGDITAELANQYIIATDKAYQFGGSVEKLTEVLDGSNYITNHNTVSMTDLAEGMSIVGAQAASLGVKANETTAVLGTMIATTQQSGSEMARAFRAILLNLQQVTDEEEGIDAEGLTKYENACKALNVSLKETKNGVTSLRNPMEVIKGLATEYSKLDSNDIRITNLLSSVGGKLRATALSAILENYDMYERMLQEYANGTGFMATEAKRAANSWEGSMNHLSNTWTDTIENIAHSDAIITIINSFNSLLSVVNNITDKLGSLKSIGFGAGLFAGIRMTKDGGGLMIINNTPFLATVEFSRDVYEL